VRLFLGVDGGQSSTKAVVGDESGVVLGRGVGGPCNHVKTGDGRAKFVGAITACVEAALLDAGLDSAQAIASMSPSAFAETFADKFGGPTQAMQYHQKAQQLNASVLAIASAVKHAFAGGLPGVIQPVSESVKWGTRYPFQWRVS